jgi:ferredoxin
MKVKVDRELCMGLSNCVAIAPTVFELDEENKVIIKDASSVNDKILLEAAESCPYSAIIIEDDKGQQLYP